MNSNVVILDLEKYNGMLEDIEFFKNRLANEKKEISKIKDIIFKENLLTYNFNGHTLDEVTDLDSNNSVILRRELLNKIGITDEEIKMRIENAYQQYKEGKRYE